MSKNMKFPKESGISVARVFGESKKEEKTPVVSIKDIDKQDTTDDKERESAPVEAAIEKDIQPENTKSGKLIEECGLLNLRKNTSTDSDVLALIRPGDDISIYPDPIDITPGWALVSVNGKRGYVIRKFIKEA